jgi:hypothetical protein
MTTLKLIIPLFLFTTAYGQSNSNLVKNWISHTIPTNKDTLDKYNSDMNDWIVGIEKNEVYTFEWTKNYKKDSLPFEIKPSIPEERLIRGRRFVTAVEDGYLIGFNRGEWGGTLYWFSKDGTKKYKISNDQIIQFKIRNKKIYAIEGLSHLSISEGRIIEIKKENGIWTSVEYLKLADAPEALDLDNKNNFVIVTTSSLVLVDTNKKLKVLIAKGIWDYFLYPNSLVIQNENLYIGMRKGIFKYNTKTKKQEWLLPN